MTRSSMRRTKKIRASKDEQLQEDTLPLTQRPGFIIGMTFLGVFVAFIISVLIFRFIHKTKYSMARDDGYGARVYSKSGVFRDAQTGDGSSAAVFNSGEMTGDGGGDGDGESAV